MLSMEKLINVPRNFKQRSAVWPRGIRNIIVHDANRPYNFLTWFNITNDTGFANNGYIDFIPWVSREQGKISFVVCVLATETAPVAAMSLTVRPIHNS